jgi:tetratricopeptide (TPR) repeat protein
MLKSGLLLLLVVLPLRAFADDVAEAKRRFKSANQHYALGEYQQALDDFKAGYRAKEDPVFLYNIAQCYRALNDNQNAVSFYKSYLREAPNPPNREEVESKIHTLEEALATQQRARTAPPSTVLHPEGGEGTPRTTTNAAEVERAAPPPEKTPVYKKWWLWAAVGGVVAVGLGVGLGVGLTRGSTTSSPFPAVQF